MNIMGIVVLILLLMNLMLLVCFYQMGKTTRERYNELDGKFSELIDLMREFIRQRPY